MSWPKQLVLPRGALYICFHCVTFINGFPCPVQARLNEEQNHPSLQCGVNISWRRREILILRSIFHSREFGFDVGVNLARPSSAGDRIGMICLMAST
jgi:hypothetical protein